MANKFFSKEDIKKIEDAIAVAEKNSSGEIRVHIDKKCDGELMDCAANRFAKLEMHKTELRNGVLFYLAYEDKKFAVLGDVGINQKVPDGFWDDVVSLLSGYFRNSEFTTGLCEGILKCGEKLKEFFPYSADDVNELPNDVSFGA